MHSTTDLERISFYGDSLQVLLIETGYQPVISFFRMTGTTKNRLRSRICLITLQPSPLESVPAPFRRTGTLYASSSGMLSVAVALRHLTCFGHYLTEFIHHLGVRFGFLNQVFIASSLSELRINSSPNGARSMETTSTVISLYSRTRPRLLGWASRPSVLRSPTSASTFYSVSSSPSRYSSPPTLSSKPTGVSSSQSLFKRQVVSKSLPTKALSVFAAQGTRRCPLSPLPQFSPWSHMRNIQIATQIHGSPSQSIFRIAFATRALYTITKQQIHHQF